MEDIASHDRQPASMTSEPGFQMSVPRTRNEESVTTHSAQPDFPAPVEEEFDDFAVPREKSNSTDPGRRAREFRARHIQMMALGAAIGAGLLYQSGKGLYEGGPVGLWVGYLLMGTVMYAILITLGEMISFLPIPGGFFALANRFLSPAIVRRLGIDLANIKGFACGWAYWAAYVLAFPAKLVAAQKIMAFWLPDGPSAVWISIFYLLPSLFNLFNVRRYGEIEFWLTWVKLVTILGIIVLGVLLPMGAVASQPLLGTSAQGEIIPCPPNPSAGECVSPPGFIYWRENAFASYILPGAAGRFLGFWACCCQAIFSYVGTEIIGIAADETERQRETLPKAVRRVSYRLSFYYIGAIVVLGLNVSSTDPVLVNSLTTSSYFSPFVLMVERAGIPGLAHVINAVALIAVLSVANANLYVSSRTLYALAREGHGPRIFEKKYRDVPFFAVIASAVPGVLGYMSLKVSSNNVFDFLAKLTVTCALIPWAIICATYLRFRKAVKKQSMRRAIPKKAVSPFQPYLAIYGLTWSVVLIIFQGFEVFSRSNVIWNFLASSWGFTIAPWLAIACFLILVLAWLARGYVMNGSWTWDMTSLNQCRLHDGIAPYIEEDEKPKSKMKRGFFAFLDFI